jgi:hypothetical protein
MMVKKAGVVLLLIILFLYWQVQSYFHFSGEFPPRKRQTCKQRQARKKSEANLIYSTPLLKWAVLSSDRLGDRCEDQTDSITEAAAKLQSRDYPNALPYCIPDSDTLQQLEKLAAARSEMTSPVSNLLLGKSHDVCLRCAVVGSSGNLVGKHMGQTIDSHDIVIRMNGAPTAGFEADVGGRTTLRTIFADELDAHLALIRSENSTVLMTLRNEGDAALLLEAKKRVDLPNMHVLPLDAFAHGRKFLDALIVGKCEAGCKRPRPTTGFVITLWATHFCDTVSLFGFSSSFEPNSKVPFHYFSNDPEPALTIRGRRAIHNREAEHLLTAALDAEGLVMSGSGGSGDRTVDLHALLQPS